MKNFNTDETLYLKAKEYIRKTKPENRGDLFYALLDWCDNHQEILKSIACKEDTYDVLYIDKDGVSHEDSFCGWADGNPQRFARQRYFYLIDNGAQVIELRHRPNPYICGPERNGSLVSSYEKEV